MKVVSLNMLAAYCPHKMCLCATVDCCTHESCLQENALVSCCSNESCLHRRVGCLLLASTDVIDAMYVGALC